MARRRRLFIANIPYHVIQRGNNRNPIFFNDKDYLFFLKVLKEAKAKHPCFLYAYCLMPNHFHFILEPLEKDNISFLMKFLGAKYVHYINRTYGRSGTLWEGRFRCSLIDEESYFLSCLRYIETNPLRAGLTKSPDLYQWSSYHFRTSEEKNSIIDLDPWYDSLGTSPLERQARYRHFINSSAPKSEYNLIREMTQKNGIIGDQIFRHKMEKILGITINLGLPGRPMKIKK
jgi:putative transposase